MNKKIDFNDVPKNYLYCTYNKCPRRNECLRHQATLRIPQNVPDFRTVNPNQQMANGELDDFHKSYFAEVAAQEVRDMGPIWFRPANKL